MMVSPMTGAVMVGSATVSGQILALRHTGRWFRNSYPINIFPVADGGGWINARNCGTGRRCQKK
ncbi:MAG: hypothetical protein QM405_03720 [Euryarchaeota archaeon]|nr:hypothetical protein [Euryarchaeota archaeon]